jgi:hypothetical protein
MVKFVAGVVVGAFLSWLQMMWTDAGRFQIAFDEGDWEGEDYPHSDDFPASWHE